MVVSPPIPVLPGPAALVQHVPSHAELVKVLLKAGFAGIQLETLSSSVHFKIGEVALREILIVASKPGHRPAKTGHAVIYLGPSACVTDDFGNTFRRGEMTALNIHDWQVLSKSVPASHFLFHEP